MSATDELRRLLTEAGVVWWNQIDPEPQTVTMARLGDQLIEYHENVNGTMGYHVWNMRELTPAQTIAATLDDVPRLPYFWTADGTLHIELPKLPESISVRLPDQRDREVGSARTWQYTRGSDSDATRERQDDARTCHIVKASRKYVLSDGTELFEDGCSVCNGYIGEGDNYCSNCGAKVVDG